MEEEQYWTLWATHTRHLVTCLLRRYFGQGPMQCEDAVSRASIRLLPSIAEIHGERQFLAFAFQACRATMIDMLRWERRQYEYGALALQRSEGQSAGGVPAVEAAHDARYYLEHVRSSQQARFLATWEGDYAAYAREHGLSIGAVKAGNAKMRRAAHRLRHEEECI